MTMKDDRCSKIPHATPKNDDLPATLLDRALLPNPIPPPNSVAHTASLYTPPSSLAALPPPPLLLFPTPPAQNDDD